MRISYNLYQFTIKCFKKSRNIWDNFSLLFYFKLYKIKHDSYKTYGFPFLRVGKHSKFIIGSDFRMNNGLYYNTIGYPQPCAFVVSDNGCLKIGNKVGMSQTTIVCHDKIVIGDNVKIGGGVKIYDSDFHSLDPIKRQNRQLDELDKKTAPVFIKDNVFVGAGTLILKGVTIGQNAIVGAGSVVTKSIPNNEIWAGNPAKFISKF